MSQNISNYVNNCPAPLPPPTQKISYVVAEEIYLHPQPITGKVKLFPKSSLFWLLNYFFFGGMLRV